MADIHPGSFVGDTIEEIKKLPTWGKIAIGVGVLVVVYIAYRGYQGSKGSAPSQATTLPATSNASGSQSPFPSITSGGSSVPLLPSNVSPIYNSQGGLTGYQQSASPPPPTTVGATPSPSSGGTTSTGTPPFFGILGPGLNFASASKALPGQKLISGGQNRVWQVAADGTQTLVTSGYGPAVTNSGYKNGQGPATPGATAGAGGMSLSSYIVHAGENVNESMQKLGLDWPTVAALNGYPNTLSHGDRLRLQ